MVTYSSLARAQAAGRWSDKLIAAKNAWTLKHGDACTQGHEAGYCCQERHYRKCVQPIVQDENPVTYYTDLTWEEAHSQGIGYTEDDDDAGELIRVH
jgi:hypothetical protein